MGNTKYDPAIHHRRSIRLPEYDYSRPGAYFITIVTQGRACLFGEISDGQMSLNPAGESIQSWWHRLPDKFPSTIVDSFVVMPNHVHGVVVIDDMGQTHRSAPTGPPETVGADRRVRPEIRDVRTAFRPHPHAPISQMVQWFKTMTTNGYIRGVGQLGWAPFAARLWQRNYYEHVIRDTVGHERIHSYIESNPRQWADDAENPSRIG